MTIKPSPFGVAVAEPAPEKGAGKTFPEAKAADSEAQGKSHGGGGIGIGACRNLMQGIQGKTLGRQMPIEGM